MSKKTSRSRILQKKAKEIWDLKNQPDEQHRQDLADLPSGEEERQEKTRVADVDRERNLRRALFGGGKVVEVDFKKREKITRLPRREAVTEKLAPGKEDRPALVEKQTEPIMPVPAENPVEALRGLEVRPSGKSAVKTDFRRFRRKRR